MQSQTSNQLSFKQLLKDIFWYDAAMAGLILGSSYYNAEMWLNDYPPDIKEKFGPMSDKAKKQGLIVAIPFFFIMVGGIIWSNLRLRKANGGHLGRKAAFLNAFALIFSGWFYDLTILDWLIFVKVTPSFVVLPGTEGMAGYDDYGFHLREHMRALPFLALGALIIAFLTANK
ncbi:MAG: nitroreductase [Ardenticatenaceae bacterium]|nr:nitroreductase [Ardenticatenaceae bacterium]